MKKLLTLLITISATAMADPTYTKDIKPIFKNRCSQCDDYIQGKYW